MIPKKHLEGQKLRASELPFGEFGETFNDLGRGGSGDCGPKGFGAVLGCTRFCIEERGSHRPFFRNTRPIDESVDLEHFTFQSPPPPLLLNQVSAYLIK